MGEPAGIGGEILLAAWRRLAATGPVFLAIDDPARLRALAGDTPIREVADPAEAASVFGHALPVLALGQRVAAEPGRPDPRHGAAVIASIVRAVALTRAGATAAVVTNPIHKATLYAGGLRLPRPHRVPGRARRRAAAGDDAGRAVAEGGAAHRAHPAGRGAAPARSGRASSRQARIVAEALRRDFGIARPRLAVAGLNPHAGEDGAMGDEEAQDHRPGAGRPARGGHRRRWPAGGRHHVPCSAPAPATMRPCACTTTRR